MTSRQGPASAALTPPATAAALTPTANILKQQQQSLSTVQQQQQQQHQQQQLSTSPRVNFITPQDGGGTPANSGGVGPPGLPPGVTNALGGMALPLLIAQQQQLQLAVAANNPQGPPIYFYPHGMQPSPGTYFPCYLPGPYPHPGGAAGPFSPAAATTAAIMAAMTANQNQLPGSPFFPGQGIATPLTPVFRFNQQQQQPQQQAPPMLQLPQQQLSNAVVQQPQPPSLHPAVSLQPPLPPSSSNNNSTSSLAVEGDRRMAPSKVSVGVGDTATSSRLLQPPSTAATNGSDTTGNAVPVNSFNNNSNALSNVGLPYAVSTGVATGSSSSSLTSPKQPVIISPPGVNSSGGQHLNNNNNNNQPKQEPLQQQPPKHEQQQHVIRQNPLSHLENNGQAHHHHLQSQQQQQQQQQSPQPSPHQQAASRQRKRPPNLTIPHSNFDVAPGNSASTDGGWPSNNSGGNATQGASVPKTPKTAPTLNSNWANQQQRTPRSGAPIMSAGHPQRRGRPPLHHKPPISADHVMNGFPSSHNHFSSSSSTYNSPNPMGAPMVNSANSYSTGSDHSASLSVQTHQQQEVVVNSPSHLLYPDHFKRGSLIRLADGSFKCVEDMSTSDFTRSAQLSGELRLDSSQVLQIEPNLARGAAMLYLAVGDQSPINIHVEAPLEHPFFVFNVGWSSCDPDRTRARYGLNVNLLRVGDKCISLTRKPPPVPPAVPPSQPEMATTGPSIAPPPPPPPPPPVSASTSGSVGISRRPTITTTTITAPQLQPTAATSEVASIKDSRNDAMDTNEQRSTTTISTIKEAEDIESIATASLLSLQQSDKTEVISRNSGIAVSSSSPHSAAGITVTTTNITTNPTTTTTITAPSTVIRSTEPVSSPLTPTNNLMIVEDTVIEPGSVKTESVLTDYTENKNGQFGIVSRPTACEDQSSTVSEPLVAEVSNSSCSNSKGNHAQAVTHKTSHIKSRFATHHLRQSKPRLLLFPGQHLVASGTSTKPGAPTYAGLRRRRHRSTSALALAELSPKSKLFVLHQNKQATEVAVVTNNKADSAIEANQPKTAAASEIAATELKLSPKQPIHSLPPSSLDNNPVMSVDNGNLSTTFSSKV